LEFERSALFSAQLLSCKVLNVNMWASTSNSITEAYNILSNPDLRTNYDALRYESPSSQAEEKGLDPICCANCSRVTAQPRSTVFYQVISLLLVTTRTPVQGIFCSECARKIGLRASLVTACLGWWGFPWGPIWTISSILSNACGGKHSKDMDDKLLWYNALAFYSKGKLAMSYALALQARRAADSEIANNAAKLMDRLQTAGVRSSSPTLKNPWLTKPLLVSVHFAFLIAIPSSSALRSIKKT